MLPRGIDELENGRRFCLRRPSVFHLLDMLVKASDLRPSLLFRILMEEFQDS